MTSRPAVKAVRKSEYTPSSKSFVQSLEEAARPHAALRLPLLAQIGYTREERQQIPGNQNREEHIRA